MAKLQTDGARHLQMTGSPSQGKDLDLTSVLEARGAFSADDIRFKYNASISSPHGSAAFQNIATSPFLGTLPVGLSSSLFKLGPCGTVPPHTHPRASEHIVVTTGRLKVGFVEESGGRGVIQSVIGAGETWVQPQGLLHFVLNPTCDPAEFIAFFPTTDGGASPAPTDLLLFDDDVLRATVNSEDLSAFETLRALVFPASPVPSADPVCLKRCGLA
jgi:quercetin dioxygenase-like cupin family protein